MLMHWLCTSRDGFGEVFPLHSLNCFHEDELEAMLCGAGETWTVEMLAETLKFDHGLALSWGMVLNNL